MPKQNAIIIKNQEANGSEELSRKSEGSHEEDLSNVAHFHALHRTNTLFHALSFAVAARSE